MTEANGAIEPVVVSVPFFQTTRDRDATATIRGFVYQVDITLLRWLTLLPDERLELECGEDIDRIRQVLSADEGPPERVFEAIKNREARLTLRSEEALEALAGFHEHRLTNPGLPLRFRYITNCEIGREKIAVDNTGAPGVQIWEDVRLGKYGADDAVRVSEALRYYLSKARKPSKLNEGTWRVFGAFLADASSNDFRDFIKFFEWSTRNPSATDMQDAVMDSIRSRRRGDRNNERLYYNHLFVFVFGLLSHPGPKLLDEVRLDQLLAEARPDVEADAIISRIQRFEQHFARRLDRIEGTLAEQSPKLDRILSAVIGLARPGGSSPEFAPEVALMLDVPPPETRLCVRRELVESLATTLESAVWLAVSGGIGAGKTQLAILVAQRFSGTNVWLRLRGLDPSEAQRRLDAAMTALCQVASGHGSIKALYSAACDTLAADSLIVVDDVKTTGRDAFSDRLIILAEACAQTGVRLVTTSGDALPGTLASRCDHIQEEVTPPFNPMEVKDLLVVQGCPESELTDSRVHAIHLFSHGHPVLLGAIARVLERHHWRFDGAVFLDLIGGKLGSDLTESVQDWLMETVVDESARHLLYRIRAIGAPFSDREVTVIAGVQPEISAPIEKLRRLTGLWIQHDSQSVYIASPLVQKLNDNNLPEQTKLAVHLSLAREVMRKRKLGPYEVTQAFLHFASAGHLNEAAFVLLIALQGIANTPGDFPEDFGLTAIWTEQELPKEIDLGTRIFLRSSQAVIQLRRGRDAAYLLRDLDRLADSAQGHDRLAVLGASGLVGIWLGKSDPVRASQYVLRALIILRSTKVPDDVFPEMSVTESYLLMLWLVAISINSSSQLTAWLDVLRMLTPSERAECFALETSAKASESIITAIWLREAELAEAERDWARLVRELTGIARTAEELGLEVLYLQAQRAIILISSQLLNETDNALKLAEHILHQYAGSAKAEFLIAEMMARQLYFSGRSIQSLPWWERALTARSAAEPEALVTALTVAGVAAVDAKGDKSLTYLREAARLSIDLPQSAWQTAVRAQGELAIVLWNQQELKSSYESWASAAGTLIANRDDSADWKIIFRIFGSCSTYFGRGFRRDSSDWNYVVPASGILLRRPEAVASSYQPAQEWLLPAAIAMFAWEAGAYTEAGKWTRQATELGQDRGDDDRLFQGFRPILLIYELPLLLNQQSPDRLIDSIVKLRPGASPTDDVPILGDGAEREREIVARLSRLSADVAVFAVGLHLLRRALDEPEKAASYARAICERCAVISDAPQDFWSGCAEVFSDMFGPDLSWAALYEKGRLHASSSLSFPRGFLYYCASMRIADAPSALRLQLAVLRSLEITFRRMASPCADIYRLVVPAFVVEFWNKTVDAQPFHFGQIRLLRQQLTALSKNEAPTSAELKSVIQAVAQSLGTNLAKEDREWLLASDSL